jgi:hypothetical protein
MANTTNFNWETPDDTDLVKDGAAAIRTLGSAIDTSLVDLKGGTTGQVLSKATNTDMDFTWVAQDDSNAIQNAIVDAKGDLISATAADTPARLAVGANGTVLTADSAEATGLKWAAPAGGSTFVGCSLTKSTGQNISNNTLTYFTYNTENIDTDGFHDNSTNNTRITIPTGKAGKYLLTAFVVWPSNATGYRSMRFTKNGSTALQEASIGTVAQEQLQSINNVFALAEGDYVEVGLYQNSGSTLNPGATINVGFSAVYLGA